MIRSSNARLPPPSPLQRYCCPAVVAGDEHQRGESPLVRTRSTNKKRGCWLATPLQLQAERPTPDTYTALINSVVIVLVLFLDVLQRNARTRTWCV